MSRKTLIPILQTLAQKRRWTPEEARQVLAARRPGETHGEFSARVGVDRGRVARWTSTLRRVTEAMPVVSRAEAELPATFASVGTFTLGRPRPIAVVEFIGADLRLEIHDADHGEICVAAVLRALEAPR